jgi:hypothetical protein
MGPYRRTWRRSVLSVVVLLAGVAGAIVAPVAAGADQVPVDINVVPSCDSATGLWNVDWLVQNQTPAPVVFERAEDPTTGTPIPVPGFALTSYAVIFLDAPDLPGTRTTTGIYVWIRRIDRPEAVRYGGVFALPGTCTVQAPPTNCVDRRTARYQHTFDGATGVATVEVVGAQLCPGEFASVTLASYGEINPDAFPTWLYPYDQSGAWLSDTHRKVALRVTLPPCKAKVELELWDPFEIAGTPGGRSTGPYAVYENAGITCRSQPSVSTTTECDGSVRIQLANAATATTPVQFAFVDVYPGRLGMFRTLVLEAGESTTVNYTVPVPRGQIDIYVNGVRLTSAKAPTLRQCKAQARPSWPAPPRRPRLLF